VQRTHASKHQVACMRQHLRPGWGVPVDADNNRLLLLPRLLPLPLPQVLPLLLVRLRPLEQRVDARVGDGLVVVVQRPPSQQAEVRPSVATKTVVSTMRVLLLMHCCSCCHCHKQQR
jgi:hypothetical protein